MTINGRTKGSNAEREFARYITNVFGLQETPKRNLEQTREGGHDFIIEPFLFEIKRCEVLNFRDWWLQVTQAKKTGNYLDLHRVVAFRQNRKSWEFLISARHIGLESGYVRLEKREFEMWSKSIYEAYIYAINLRRKEVV